MSFSLPKNVPSFDSSQRDYENTYWGSLRTAHNGHTTNGRGKNIGTFSSNQGLPMYKDKPYSYAASRRQRPLWKRRRFWLGVALSLISLFYLLNHSAFHGLRGREMKVRNKRKWGWLRGSAEDVADWELRRESVKEAFKSSWDGYERYAWGMSLMPRESRALMKSLLILYL